MAPEFSRPIAIDTLGDGVRAITVEASEAERAALAERFGLIAIDELSAQADLTRGGDAIAATGRFTARVVQSCVATAVPLPATLSESFSLRFVPALGAEGEEIELAEEDCDVVEYDGAAVDLGEAVAETMALALDPFPRSPDADEILKAAGVLEEGDVGPFSALKALKDKMGG